MIGGARHVPELRQYRSVTAVHSQNFTGACRSPAARVLTSQHFWNLDLCLTCRTPAHGGPQTTQKQPVTRQLDHLRCTRPAHIGRTSILCLVHCHCARDVTFHRGSQQSHTFKALGRACAFFKQIDAQFPAMRPLAHCNVHLLLTLTPAVPAGQGQGHMAPWCTCVTHSLYQILRSDSLSGTQQGA